jgi:hypothetical protein
MSIIHVGDRSEAATKALEQLAADARERGLDPDDLEIEAERDCSWVFDVLGPLDFDAARELAWGAEAW